MTCSSELCNFFIRTFDLERIFLLPICHADDRKHCDPKCTTNGDITCASIENAETFLRDEYTVGSQKVFDRGRVWNFSALLNKI